jgi:hypothetical protein
MSIDRAEIKWYKSTQMNDTASNGGRMSNTVATSNAKNAIWPDVTQAERTAGSTKYRKLHIKIENATNLTLQDTKIFVENFTVAQDAVLIFPGTHTDTQNDLTGSERLYGSGALQTSVTVGGATLAVATEAASFNVFRLGDMIRISNKSDIDGTGAEEYLSITSTPSYAGNICTFNVSPTLSNDYSSTNTRVASVIEAGDIEAGFTNFVVSSASGTYDEGTYPIVVGNIGGTAESWTLTFVNGTQFNIVGSVSGAVGSGTISSNAVPVNTAFGTVYWTLNYMGFGGTWQTNDTITFATTPATYPIWYKRVVPPGAASFSANKVIVVVDGEST